MPIPSCRFKVSKDLLNILYDSELPISKLNSFHSLIVQGKKKSKIFSKNLIGKHSQKLIDHAKQFATGALKTTSKIPIQKTAEATGDLIGNKIADKVTKVSMKVPLKI